jgi:hypothetical protein
MRVGSLFSQPEKVSARPVAWSNQGSVAAMPQIPLGNICWSLCSSYARVTAGKQLRLATGAVMAS